MSAPVSISIRAGTPLTNPRVSKSPFSDGLNGSSSKSGPLLDLAGLTSGPLLVKLLDKIFGIRFSSLIPGSRDFLSESDVSFLVWVVLSVWDY